MTSNKAKLVNAPLNINDMDEDLESKTVYVFNYSKSSLQGLDFLNYIKNTSVVSDIFISADVPTFTKNTLLESYMKSSTFYHITSFNLTILNMIYIIKKSKKRIEKATVYLLPGMQEKSIRCNIIRIAMQM